MLKSKSIGACLALTFALLIGSGMTTYADTGAVNTEEVNTEEGSAQEAAEQASSSIVEAGTVSGAKKAAAKAAKAVAESVEEDKEQQPVVEAGASRRGEKSGAAKETAAEEDAADAAEQTDDGAAQEAAASLGGQTSGLRSLGVFRTTGYCPCLQCSEGWGRRTCTGAIAQANHTIAVDPRVIPYGSRVMINGVIYTAEDRGGGVKGNHIDIFYDTHAQTRQHGSRSQEVFLLS